MLYKLYYRNKLRSTILTLAHINQRREDRPREGIGDCYLQTLAMVNKDT
jgi:hypothetical protein